MIFGGKPSRNLVFMCPVIYIFDFIRQIIRNHLIEPVFIAVFNGLLIVPAFEINHIKDSTHFADFLLDDFLAAQEKNLLFLQKYLDLKSSLGYTIKISQGGVDVNGHPAIRKIYEMGEPI